MWGRETPRRKQYLTNTAQKWGAAQKKVEEMLPGNFLI
jgi:hypothetical protein